jgi:hypothetical protein
MLLRAQSFREWPPDILLIDEVDQRQCEFGLAAFQSEMRQEAEQWLLRLLMVGSPNPKGGI